MDLKSKRWFDINGSRSRVPSTNTLDTMHYLFHFPFSISGFVCSVSLMIHSQHCQCNQEGNRNVGSKSKHRIRKDSIRKQHIVHDASLHFSFLFYFRFHLFVMVFYSSFTMDHFVKRKTKRRLEIARLTMKVFSSLFDTIHDAVWVFYFRCNVSKIRLHIP